MILSSSMIYNNISTKQNRSWKGLCEPNILTLSSQPPSVHPLRKAMAAGQSDTCILHIFETKTLKDKG